MERSLTRDPSPQRPPLALRAGVVALAFVLVLGAGLTAGAQVAAAGPTLALVEGSVEIGSGDPPRWRAARAGDALEAGLLVRVGAGSRAELALPKGTVRLYENSVLRLPQDAFGDEAARAVELESGSGLFDVAPRSSDQGFQVRTPEAVVMVKGTRFSVDLSEGRAFVSVFHGLVGVRGAGQTLEHEVLVRPGLTAVGGRHQAFELLLDPSGDPWGRWREEQRKLPALPDAKTGASDALRESVRREVTGELVKQDPALRRAIERKLADEEDLEARARLDTGRKPAPAHPDAVADSPQEAPTKQIAEAFAERELNADGSLVPQVFDVEFVGSSGSGPARVIFFQSDGTPIGSLTPTELQKIVDDSQVNLYPAAVLQNLVTNQTDPVRYAELLRHLLMNR